MQKKKTLAKKMSCNESLNSCNSNSNNFSGFELNSYNLSSESDALSEKFKYQYKTKKTKTEKNKSIKYRKSWHFFLSIFLENFNKRNFNYDYRSETLNKQIKNLIIDDLNNVLKMNFKERNRLIGSIWRNTPKEELLIYYNMAEKKKKLTEKNEMEKVCFQLKHSNTNNFKQVNQMENCLSLEDDKSILGQNSSLEEEEEEEWKNKNKKNNEKSRFGGFAKKIYKKKYNIKNPSKRYKDNRFLFELKSGNLDAEELKDLKNKSVNASCTSYNIFTREFYKNEIKPNLFEKQETYQILMDIYNKYKRKEISQQETVQFISKIWRVNVTVKEKKKFIEKALNEKKNLSVLYDEKIKNMIKSKKNNNKEIESYYQGDDLEMKTLISENNIYKRNKNKFTNDYAFDDFIENNSKKNFASLNSKRNKSNNETGFCTRNKSNKKELIPCNTLEELSSENNTEDIWGIKNPKFHAAIDKPNFCFKKHSSKINFNKDRNYLSFNENIENKATRKSAQEEADNEDFQYIKKILENKNKIKENANNYLLNKNNEKTNIHNYKINYFSEIENKNDNNNFASLKNIKNEDSFSLLEPDSEASNDSIIEDINSIHNCNNADLLYKRKKLNDSDILSYHSGKNESFSAAAFENENNGKNSRLHIRKGNYQHLKEKIKFNSCFELEKNEKTFYFSTSKIKFKLVVKIISDESLSLTLQPNPYLQAYFIKIDLEDYFLFKNRLFSDFEKIEEVLEYLSYYLSKSLLEISYNINENCYEFYFLRIENCHESEEPDFCLEEEFQSRENLNQMMNEYICRFNELDKKFEEYKRK